MPIEAQNNITGTENFSNFTQYPKVEIDPKDGGGLVKPDVIIPESKPVFKSTLAEEIAHLHSNWQEEDLSSNWADLSGSGFHVDDQMRFLTADVAGTTTPFEYANAVDHWIKGTEDNLKGFVLEYLLKGKVFPIKYELGEVNGQTRIINNLHGGGGLLVETIDESERHGVVKKTLTEKMEPFFLQAPEGSIGVMVSPSGWSGMINNEGDAIEFPNSQTYVWQKRGNEIVGYTIVTDFGYEEHREFLKRLNGHELPENADVCDYVADMATLTPDQIGSIKEVVDVMKDVRFEASGSIFADEGTTTDEGTTWDDIYKNLGKGWDLWNFDEEINTLIRDFGEFARDNQGFDRQSLKEAITVTIIRIIKLLDVESDDKTQSTQMQQGSGSLVFEPKSKGSKYNKALAEIRKRAGCAGGGKTKIKMNGITPREVISSKGVDGKGDSEAACPKCGAGVPRPFGGFASVCLSCGDDEIAC